MLRNVWQWKSCAFANFKAVVQLIVVDDRMDDQSFRSEYKHSSHELFQLTSCSYVWVGPIQNVFVGVQYTSKIRLLHYTCYFSYNMHNAIAKLTNSPLPTKAAIKINEQCVTCDSSFCIWSTYTITEPQPKVAIKSIDSIHLEFRFRHISLCSHGWNYFYQYLRCWKVPPAPAGSAISNSYSLLQIWMYSARCFGQHNWFHSLSKARGQSCWIYQPGHWGIPKSFLYIEEDIFINVLL